MLLRRWLLLLLLPGLGPVAAASAQALRVCMADVPHAPWRIPDADGRVRDKGLDFWLLRRFAQRSGWTFTVQHSSGRRCMQELAEGHSDALLGLSYLPERAQLVRYPMKDGHPDESLALRLDSYSWFVTRAGRLPGDGGALQLPAGALVAAQSGHSIVQVLTGMAYQVDDSARTVLPNLRKVLDGKVLAAALHTLEADRELALSADLRQQLRRLAPPLSVRPYYLVFSHGFAERHESALPALWRQFSELARSAAFQQAYRDATRSP